jgi:hypothetical protein
MYMEKYGLIDQNNKLISYSDILIEDYSLKQTNKDGTFAIISVTCLEGVPFNTDNIGKIYNSLTKTFSDSL